VLPYRVMVGICWTLTRFGKSIEDAPAHNPNVPVFSHDSG